MLAETVFKDAAYVLKKRLRDILLVLFTWAHSRQTCVQQMQKANLMNVLRLAKLANL